MSIPKTSPYRLAWVSWSLVGIAAFAALLWQVAVVFATPDSPSAPTFGSAGAPYSDALGPWLVGGLAFLFDQAIPTYLYRPSIGLFWSSILGSLGRVDMIPVFFVAWLFIVLLGTVSLARDQALRNALIIWLTLSAVCFAQTWLRIPHETGHRFHAKLDTDSTAYWTPSPRESGQ